MTNPTAETLSHTDAGAGPPVVLLHPIAMRAAFWQAVAARLAPHHRVIAVDLRGHGGNRPFLDPFTIADLATDVIKLARGLDLPPAIYVGCSLGGMVAQGIALTAPDLAAGLVLANTSYRMTSESRAVMLARAEASAAGLDRTIGPDLERWFSPAFRGTHLDAVDQVRRWALANAPETVANGWRAIAGLDFENRLKDIACPVVVTTGSLDPASPPAAAPAMCAAFRDARYKEIPGAGHFSPLEAPDAFAGIVLSLAQPSASS